MRPGDTCRSQSRWALPHRRTSSWFIAILLQFLLLLSAAAPLACQDHSSAPDRPPALDFPEVSIPLPPPSVALPSLAAPPLPRNVRQFPEKYRLDRIGHRDIGSGFNLVSREHDSDIGQQFSQELDATLHFSPDSSVTEFVQRVGENVARHSDREGPIIIKVVDTDEINAFSLPGGYLYVNSGLLNFAESEAEVAGVIAHEVAHIAGRHASRTLSKGWLVATLFEIGGAALGRRTAPRIATAVTGAVVTPLLMMKFSRNFEKEADLLALQYMYDAGYDPGAYLQFLEKVHRAEPVKPRSLARLFSTHPPTEERIKYCQQFLNDYFPDREAYLVTTSTFDDIRTRLASPAAVHAQGEEDDKAPVLRRRTPGE